VNAVDLSQIIKETLSILIVGTIDWDMKELIKHGKTIYTLELQKMHKIIVEDTTILHHFLVLAQMYFNI
jgi:hypothetical protein